MKALLTRSLYNKVYSNVPRICVDIVVKNKHGILLTKRQSKQSYEGFLHIPGGRILFRETIEGAIKRIAKKELNAKVIDSKFIGLIEFRKENENGSERHSISLVHEIKVSSVKGFKFYKRIPVKTIKGQRDFLIKKYKL